MRTSSSPRRPLRRLGAASWRNPRAANVPSWKRGSGAPGGPPALFSGRVLPFDENAGLVWARLMAEGTARGRPRNALDMIVAATAEAYDCVVVTDNERDFFDVESINPLRDATR